MLKTVRLRTIAVVSLIFTYLFFYEYLPPFRRVHIPFDLDNFHFPLLDYAFQALRQGRFPEWDPTIYCGLSFVGNIQASLFYPPVWIVFAANWGRPALSYQSVEDLVFAHVWVAFLLCYVWLRRKDLAPLACILGAGAYAFSGYMVLQLQHFGLIGAYTWVPLGFLAIDETVETRRWRPLWKLAVASALAFLAGYPPSWFVVAVCFASYAAWRWKALAGTVVALGASMLLAMVQLAPAWEATRMKAPEARYGTGLRNPEAYLSYILPNYFNFEMDNLPSDHWGGDYLYLGAPALFGLGCLIALRAGRRDALPLLSVLGVTLVLLTNPFGLVWELVQHSTLLVQICRDWYFLAGLTIAAAPLAAIGLDAFLRRARRPVAPWQVFVVMGLLAAWSVRQFLVWLPGGSKFAAGWGSALDPIIGLILFSLLLFLLPATYGTLRTCALLTLLLATGIEYKVFGTSKWFNAGGGGVRNEAPRSFYGMEQKVYRILRQSSGYRIAMDTTGPFPQTLRHFGFSTPQGFDPFLTAQYQKLMERIARFRTNWLIDIEPSNDAALQLLGVRYLISSHEGPLYPQLSANARFRLLEPSRSYYKVFEYAGARPPYGWIDGGAGSSIEPRVQTPEVRQFTVRSALGGRFGLSEQFFPGWQATVDGRTVKIEHWNDAFQSIEVPRGEHRVEFRFHSAGLRIGAMVSCIAMIALLMMTGAVSTARSALKKLRVTRSAGAERESAV